MGFFGIGGSKKKEKVSDGIVHDTKQDQVDSSDDILDEFEAQFSGSSKPSHAQQTPEERVPETVHSDRAPPFTPPPEPPSNKAPQRSPEAPKPQPPEPAPPPQPSAPKPAQNAPAPDRVPVSNQPPQRPQPKAEPVASAPNPASRPSDDVPSFDFDFHPGEPAQKAPPQAPPRAQPQRPQAPTSPPPEETHVPPEPLPHEQQPTRAPEPKRRFDLPDFAAKKPFEQPRGQARTWDDLTAPAGTRPQPPTEHPPRPVPQPAQKAAPEAARAPPVHAAPAHLAQERAARREQPKDQVFISEGTLFIERSTLIRHVHDLDDLKSISISTNDKFHELEELSKDEKRLLETLSSAVGSVHTELEQVDDSLFKGDQS